MEGTHFVLQTNGKKEYYNTLLFTIGSKMDLICSKECHKTKTIDMTKACI